MIPGPLLFARYAYPPNALGYCGPEDHQALLEYGSAGVVDGGLVGLARGFEGAWPYLEIIAASNGIADPLDPRVVEAYWVGNRLLARVDMATFGALLVERFRSRAGRAWGHVDDAIPLGAVPHHSFHVFGVSPWIGLLRAGGVREPLHVMDRCRIRWGEVVASDGEIATIRSQPLVWDGEGEIGLGLPRLEPVTMGHDGKGFVRHVALGQWVSAHWDWVCDVLSPGQLRSLRSWTAWHLDIANRRLASPTPVAVGSE
jgi:Family of unknown function (DUF6390)